jgi:hypothetical protein
VANLGDFSSDFRLSASYFRRDFVFLGVNRISTEQRFEKIEGLIDQWRTNSPHSHHQLIAERYPQIHMGTAANRQGRHK